MQFEGGYRYPSSTILSVLSAIALAAALLVWLAVSFVSGLQLFLALQGTALLASAFTPVGLLPPPPDLLGRIRWLLQSTRGVSVSFNQLFFYAGLLLLVAAALVASLCAAA